MRDEQWLMNAVRLTDLTGPGALRRVHIPVPESGDAVLVEVRAVGVNFPDLLMTSARRRSTSRKRWRLGSSRWLVGWEWPSGSPNSVPDHVVPLAPGWVERVRALTGGTGVDHVLDPIGGPACVEALGAFARGGTLLVVGFAAGDIPSIEVDRLLPRKLSVVGVAWGEFVRLHPAAFAQSMAELGVLVRQGLRPLVSARFQLRDAAAALAALERGDIVGKAILERGAIVDEG